MHVVPGHLGTAATSEFEYPGYWLLATGVLYLLYWLLSTLDTQLHWFLVSTLLVIATLDVAILIETSNDTNRILATLPHSTFLGFLSTDHWSS